MSIQCMHDATYKWERLAVTKHIEEQGPLFFLEFREQFFDDFHPNI